MSGPGMPEHHNNFGAVGPQIICDDDDQSSLYPMPPAPSPGFAMAHTAHMMQANPHCHQNSQQLYAPPLSAGLSTSSTGSNPPIVTHNNMNGPSLFAGAGAAGFYMSDSHVVQINNTITPVQALEMLQQHMAPNALHDAHRDVDPPRCDEDTRVGLIEEISGWLDNSQLESRLLFMTGAAGCGKSALEQTIAEIFKDKDKLAASFFFSSVDNTRNNYSRLIPTLAYQIAQAMEGLKPFVADAIRADPVIFNRNLEAQTEALIVKPMKAFMAQPDYDPKSLKDAVFLDGLDECLGEENQKRILRVLDQYFIKKDLPFRIFLASRPENAVQFALFDENGHLNNSKTYRVNLNDHDASADIRGYLKRRLREIGQSSKDPRSRDPQWPVQTNVDQLVSNASGHFIYAATVVKYVRKPYRSPFTALEEVLTWTVGVDQQEKPFAHLDNLYGNIIGTAQNRYDHHVYDGKTVPDSRSIVRLLRMIQIKQLIVDHIKYHGLYLSVREWEKLAFLEANTMEYMLSDLHSLIQKKDEGKGVKFDFYHKSFLDYMDDPNRSGNLHIPRREIHSNLAMNSIKMLANVPEAEMVEVIHSWDQELTALGVALYSWTRFLASSEASPRSESGQGSPFSPTVFKDVLDTFAWFSNNKANWDKLVSALDPNKCPGENKSLINPIDLSTTWRLDFMKFTRELTADDTERKELYKDWQVHIPAISQFLQDLRFVV